MLPQGVLYTSSSADTGGVYSGDMRQLGKILLSHGIDLANYGIWSSSGTSESPHPFSCALIAAHNTVGQYANGRVVHGLSGAHHTTEPTPSPSPASRKAPSRWKYGMGHRGGDGQLLRAGALGRGGVARGRVGRREPVAGRG